MLYQFCYQEMDTLDSCSSSLECSLPFARLEWDKSKNEKFSEALELPKYRERKRKIHLSDGSTVKFYNWKKIGKYVGVTAEQARDRYKNVRRKKSRQDAPAEVSILSLE